MRVRWIYLVQAGLSVGLVLSLATTGVNAQQVERKFGQLITVYKSATCGCCRAWVDYLRTQGFSVQSHDVTDMDRIKAEYGVSPRLKSCHTAVTDGYVIEGHVPADDIWRLLTQRPNIIGLTAPGMPSMSPGMNSLEPKRYDVLSFDAAGTVRVYSRY